MGSKMSLDSQTTIKLLEETGLTKKEIKKRHKRFLKTYPSGRITRDQFHLIVRASDNKLFQDATTDEINHMFNIYDADSSGEIDFVEFELAYHMFNKAKDPDESIRFCLRCLDLDGSGELDKDELLLPYRRLFRDIPNLKEMLPPEINTPEKVIDGVFEEVDVDRNGSLSADEIINFMKYRRDRFEYYGLHMIFR